MSFLAILMISSSLFAQVKGGHAGVGSGGPNKYEAVNEAERAFVEAFNTCFDSKIKYTNFREIYLSLNVSDLSYHLNKIEPGQNSASCTGSNCIFAPKVKEQLRNFVAVEGFDEYIYIYYGLDAVEVKKDIKKWLGP